MDIFLLNILRKIIKYEYNRYSTTTTSNINLDKVEKVLNKLCDRLSEELPKLKGEVTLLGINSLEASSVRYRMTVLTEPMEHFGVQRLMRKEIKLELAKNGIEIPYNQVVMHNKK